MDRQCRESEGKAKIEGYMSVSDEEAHQRMVSVELYKRDGIGSDVSDPSEIERVFRIPSLRSRRRLECQGSVLRDVGYTVLCAMPRVRLRLRRWYGWNGTGWSCEHQGPILKSSLVVGSKMMYLGCDKDQ